MRAMILAAGLGTRMRPLTDHCPKPMLKVKNKPLIEYQIERLAKAGVHDIVINHAYLGDQIEEYVGDGRRWQVKVQYSAEPLNQPLETGGGIFKALPKVSPDGEPFLVVNGDIWIDLDYDQLLSDWSEQQQTRLSGNQDNELIYLVMVNNPDHHPDGDFALTEEGLLKETGEKQYTFSGVSILNPELFNGCSEGAFKLAPLLRQAMKQNKGRGQHYPGYWLDVGTPQRLNELEQHI